MPIKLDDDRTVFPAVKFNNPGDSVKVAIIRIEAIPLLAYGSNAPVLGKDGQPRSQTRLTGMVISGETTVKDGDNVRPVKEGEMVCCYIKGQSRYEFFQAKKKLDGGMLVGDILHWTFTGTAPGLAPGTTKKVYTVELRHPSENKADRTAECERQYNLLTASAGQPAAYEPYPEDDEDNAPDPFEDE